MACVGGVRGVAGLQSTWIKSKFGIYIKIALKRLNILTVSSLENFSQCIIFWATFYFPCLKYLILVLSANIHVGC